MNEQEISQRLLNAASTYVREAGLSPSQPFFDALVERLIRPAVKNIIRDDATEEQIQGAEAKLQFILQGIILAGQRELAVAGPQDVGEVEFDQELAYESISIVMLRLCPIWPFCK